MSEDPHAWAHCQQMRRLGFLFRPMTGSWVAAAPPGRSQGAIELSQLDGAGVFGGSPEALDNEMHWPIAPYAIDFLTPAGQAVYRARFPTREALFAALPESMMSSFGALHDALARTCGLPTLIELPHSRVLPAPDAFARAPIADDAAPGTPTVPNQLSML